MPDSSSPSTDASGGHDTVAPDNGDGLSFISRDRELRVSDGTRSAPLGEQASGVISTVIEGPVARVRYENLANCGESAEVRTYTLASLRARLENVTALAHHRAGRWSEAASGFRRAALVDPTFKPARVNLACALSRGGLLEEAALALAPLLRAAPVYTYLEIMSDPELEALREHPSVVALRSPHPGTATSVGFSAAYGTVAIGHGAQSWGSSHHVASVDLRDATTGELLVEHVDIGWGDTDEDGDITRPAAVRRRVEAIDRTLRDLGFMAPEPQHLVHVDYGEPYPWTARFPAERLSVVMTDSHARAIRGDTVLGQIAARIHADVTVAYFPSARLFAINWAYDMPEGCDPGHRWSDTALLRMDGLDGVASSN
jgi:hypothetical protein